MMMIHLRLLVLFELLFVIGWCTSQGKFKQSKTKPAVEVDPNALFAPLSNLLVPGEDDAATDGKAGSARSSISSTCSRMGSSCRHIGNGQFGDVYNVIGTAIKCPKRDNAEAKVAFAKEKKFLEQVKNFPNVMKLTECPHTELDEIVAEGECICTQFIDTKTDDNQERSIAKVTDFNIIAKILSKIANVLVNLKSINLIHNDIKPANIIIDKNWEPVLIDFGEARYVTDKAYVQGSIPYMSPENLQSDISSENEESDKPVTVSSETKIKHYQTYSDIWSFGVLAHEWIFGCIPEIIAKHTGQTAGATLVKKYDEMIANGIDGLYSSSNDANQLKESLNQVIDSGDMKRKNVVIGLLIRVFQQCLNFYPEKRAHPTELHRIFNSISRSNLTILSKADGKSLSFGVCNHPTKITLTKDGDGTDDEQTLQQVGTEKDWDDF